MTKAIIFDFAGVIGADGYWIWLRENVKNIEAVREGFHKISEKVDKGEISEKEFVKFISDNTGRKEAEIWPEVFKKIVINQELLQFIKSIKGKYKIGLLSNFVYEWLSEVMTQHKLYDYFDEIIISSQHKMIKPEPEIFNKMLTMLRVNKNEAIFIDDRQYNVDASNKLGIKGLLFTDLLTLRQQLRELGIEV